MGRGSDGERGRRREGEGGREREVMRERERWMVAKMENYPGRMCLFNLFISAVVCQQTAPTLCQTVSPGASRGRGCRWNPVRNPKTARRGQRPAPPPSRHTPLSAVAFRIPGAVQNLRREYTLRERERERGREGEGEGEDVGPSVGWTGEECGFDICPT